MTFAPIQWLVNRPLIRRAVDRFTSRRARKRRAALDSMDVAKIQEQTLLQLVRSAKETQFGRDHSFQTIQSVDEYQRRVPLRRYEDFWNEYCQSAFPDLQGVTWPGSIPYLALSSGTTSGATKYLPISKEMIRSNRKAGWTTLALYQSEQPMTLFRGRLFFLGGSTDLRELQSKPTSILSGDLSGIAIRDLPSMLRPYTFPPLDLALLTDWEEKLTRLAEESAKLPITLISGVPSWMLVLFDRLKQVTGRERLSDIWPQLQMVIHGGTRFDPYRRLFQDVVGGPHIRFAETYPASEGFIATEDPRYERLRLIPDHGLFFELVPVKELGSEYPTRHTMLNFETGEQYAIVLTTCAGLWSYILGDTICFEERDPPLLRFTGRTSYFLSAFGEHLISEEIEKAVTSACHSLKVTVTDFHVGPLFPETPSMPGRHRFLLELRESGVEGELLSREIDEQLTQLNEDYAAHRIGDLTLLPPEILQVKPGGFAAWMRSRGKLGGQHKVPRMDNSGELTREISSWLTTNGYCSVEANR